tara:strand:+ start:485 stop:826 length:342 start_codon:yes stop_codon:yes gene_type:complete
MKVTIRFKGEADWEARVIDHVEETLFTDGMYILSMGGQNTHMYPIGNILEITERATDEDEEDLRYVINITRTGRNNTYWVYDNAIGENKINCGHDFQTAQSECKKLNDFLSKT